ncbi:hypothetical protein B9Z19DRAFT_1157368 [Tuber borchii]|uniref:Uncharacterized protein n=1 Tax=Tuber borchii TaxID=42251 RepID=A0A2T6ZGQ7_TUBBO|nr:hypothetical protein B9Z19DRAFT_1157368 [Tuber borchii]
MFVAGYNSSHHCPPSPQPEPTPPISRTRKRKKTTPTMITNLHTVLPLLILTTTTLIPPATASTILKREVRQLPDYRSLTSCQKVCIAGTPGTLTDKVSLFYLTKCEAKACFCPPQNEPQIGQDAQKCLETEGSGVCATVEEYNGLMAFVAKYCGFEYVRATTGLLFPPSGGARTTSTLGATATRSCWDSSGYPVSTAGCSSSIVALYLLTFSETGTGKAKADSAWEQLLGSRYLASSCLLL